MRHGGQEVGLVAIGFLDQPVLFERLLGQFTHLDELRFQVGAGARALFARKMDMEIRSEPMPRKME